MVIQRRALGWVTGGAENGGHENDGSSKCPGMKLMNIKMQDMSEVANMLSFEQTSI